MITAPRRNVLSASERIQTFCIVLSKEIETGLKGLITSSFPLQRIIKLAFFLRASSRLNSMPSTMILVLLLGVGYAFGASLSDSNCQGTLPEDRIDCGYAGMHQGECELKGCCWDDTVAPGLPYCFKGKDKQRQCKAVNPKKRTDCGWYGINKTTCLVDRNCCHDDKNYGYPTKHCFYAADHKCHGTPAKERKDCGYYGISRDDCEKQRGCCWDDTVRAGLPYCYFGKDKQGDKCKAIKIDERMDCGWYGINQATCQTRKCCWDDQDYGIPTKYCFYSEDDKCFGIPPKNRVDCGYFGIDQDECEKDNGCCWDNTVPGVPYCFNGKNKQGA